MGTLTVTDAVSVDQLVGWLSAFRDEVHANGDYLTELDSAIGDADHGTNLIRGMDAVMAAIEPVPTTAADLLKKVGMTLVTSVGGASGPLYGTFFLRAATAVGESTSLDGPALVAALRGGLDGIVARGRAEAGDKTMYDALAPGLDALEAVAGLGRRPRRRGAGGCRRCGRRTRRHRADAGTQGAGQLPRRAQRRPHRPRRRVDGAAAGRPCRHAGVRGTT